TSAASDGAAVGNIYAFQGIDASRAVCDRAAGIGLYADAKGNISTGIASYHGASCANANSIVAGIAACGAVNQCDVARAIETNCGVCGGDAVTDHGPVLGGEAYGVGGC